MRIGVLMNERIANAGYRAALPFGALQGRGHDVVWNVKRHGVYDAGALAACDLVFIHRHFDEGVQRLVRGLRDAGIAIWWDNDDDIRTLPREAPNYEKVGGLRGERIFSGMVRMMRLSDVVTTPSPVLAEVYADQGIESVEVIENYVSDGFVAAASMGGRVVVGWVAGQEHRLDAERLGLREALESVCQRHPGVEVVCIGVDLKLSARYRHVPVIPFDELPRALASFDVGLAPIADNAFNRSRSNVKLKEYAAAGTPWLASPVGPYATLGERQGGRLVPDGQWAQEIGRLVDSRRARLRLARRAAKWGRGQAIGSNAQRWEAIAAKAVDIARKRSALSGEDRALARGGA